jgi:hypothetical protein
MFLLLVVVVVDGGGENRPIGTDASLCWWAAISWLARQGLLQDLQPGSPITSPVVSS